MPLRLRVLAGPNPGNMKPCPVNQDETPFIIDTPDITARVCVRIRNFTGISPDPAQPCPANTPYFDTTPDQYSLQVQARFKKSWSADDILFGNEFDTKLNLPPGSGMALKIVKWIDPGLEADIRSDKPWAYSPLLCTMNTVRIQSFPLPEEPLDDLPLPPWPSSNGDHITEETPSSLPASAAGRRKYFSSTKNRKSFTVTPDQVLDMDFYNPYVDFNKCSVKLPGFEIGVLKYWDGQPLRYAAISRDRATHFFVIQFALEEVEE